MYEIYKLGIVSLDVYLVKYWVWIINYIQHAVFFIRFPHYNLDVVLVISVPVNDKHSLKKE